MRPIVSRRNISEGLSLLRRGTQMLALVASGELPAPMAPSAEQKCDGSHTQAAWRDWLGANEHRLAFELQPRPAELDLQALILAACDRPRVRPNDSEQGRRWLVDVVRMPVVRLLLETKGARVRSSAQIEPLIDVPQSPLWDAAFLWTIAWWAGYATRLRKDSGLLKYAWAFAGERLVSRLTLAEVWATRGKIRGAI
jgi:hypothetical protein